MAHCVVCYIMLFATSYYLLCLVVAGLIMCGMVWLCHKELSCTLWARTLEAEPQHMIIDGSSSNNSDRNIDFPKFLQLMAHRQGC